MPAQDRQRPPSRTPKGATMSSTDRFPDPHAGPLAPLEQLGGWLLSVVWHAALAFSAGVIAARAMRRAHLHWSWSLAGGVLCLLRYPVIGDSAFALLAAATVVAVLGRRWHREDLDAGRDLARVAARRLARAQLPSSLLRALAARLHSAGGA